MKLSVSLGSLLNVPVKQRAIATSRHRCRRHCKTPRPIRAVLGIAQINQAISTNPALTVTQLRDLFATEEVIIAIINQRMFPAPFILEKAICTDAA